jgi:serine/threonine protein kinase/tetratricopeptide (TPR) repeat protein
MSQTEPPPSQASADDPVLADLVEELTARLQAGQAVDWEEYCRRHPAQADELRRLRPDLQALADLGTRAVQDAAAVALAPDWPGGVLGDYRLHREVGRGGMGVVYEAEQVSLGRRVALKVLPFAATLDPRQLQRFKNEAQAAAQLHHTNIVPVFAVGCERGVHFYAMQFIDGQTLAGLIQELRRLAGLPVEHPGQGSGSVRELTGRLADGSLAPAGKAPAGVPAAGTTATAAVAALTTESARGPGFFRTVARLGVQAAEALEHAHGMGVLHRDIKPSNLLLDARGNLWVTDFGLAHCQSQAGLTMSGDVVGTLRYMSPEQAVGKHGLLDHRTDIYSLGATLLETIVLKALAEEPDGRYATTQELADDLRRFLEDKPIRAKRPTPWQRGRKWVRRHQGTVVTAGVASVIVLLTVMAALIVGIIQVKAEERRTKHEHEAAVAAQKREAENYRMAKESYRLARDGLEKVVKTVTDDPRLNGGELATVVRAVRTEEAKFYHQFVELRHDDPDFRAERATTLAKLAAVTAVLESLEDAIVYYVQAQDLVAALTRDHPDVPRYQALLAKIEQDLGIVCRQTARWRQAEQALRHAVALDRALVLHHSSAPEYQASLAFGLHNLGSLYEQTSRSPEAEEAYQEALPLRKGLVQRHPDVPKYQYDLARSYIDLATLFLKTRRFSAAEQLFPEALALLETLVRVYPNTPAYRQALAGAHNNLCILYQQTKRRCEAEESLQEALAQQQALVRQSPLVTEYRVDLGGTQCNLAGMAQLNGHLEACLDWASQSIATLEAVRAKEPHHAAALQILGNAYQGRFEILNQMQRYAESLHDLDKLLELRGASPSRDNFRAHRAVTLARLQRHAEATAEAEDLLGFSQGDGARLYKLAVVYALSAAARDADRPQAEQYAARAVQLLRQAVAKGRQNVEALKKDADFDAVRPRPEFQKLLNDLEKGKEEVKPRDR